MKIFFVIVNAEVVFYRLLVVILEVKWH